MLTHRTHPDVTAGHLNLTPPVLAGWMSAFRGCFSAPVWSRVLVLAAGAVLAPGKRTVSQALRVMGLAANSGFSRYHEVLNRACWDGRAVARTLLVYVLGAFLPAGEVVIGVDDTIERRWGIRIKARGLYRDPVRSSRGHFVRASGLRWLSLMVMVPIPWAGRRWALPFLTVLAPSERWSSERGRRHKTVVDWARQAVLQARRWLPGRRLVMVADAGFSGVGLIAALHRHACLVTRLRIDASLFAPAPPRRPGQMGRPRLKGKRLPALKAVLANPNTVWSRVNVAEWYGGRSRELEVASGTAVWYYFGLPPAPILWVLVRYPDGRREPEAFLCTDTGAEPRNVLDCFNRRWAVETTYEEARAHLGMETQRQWSDPAIFRTTPLLLGLYSVVTLYVHQNAERLALSPRRAAWYPKPAPTFGDAIARLRQHLWFERIVTSAGSADMTQSIPPAMQSIIKAACYAQ